MKLVHNKRCTNIAAAEVDIWAVGVIAYELVVGGPVFPKVDWTGEDVQAAALGTRPYPWEDAVGSFKNIPVLQGLRGPLRACLSRDPQERPSAEVLLKQLNTLSDS